jgi:hypothetical protein
MYPVNHRRLSSLRSALTPHHLRWLFGIAVSVLSASCAAPNAPRPAAASGNEATPAESAVARESAPDLTAHMQASFWEAIRARDALIAGDLPTAQRAAELRDGRMRLALERLSALRPSPAWRGM